MCGKIINAGFVAEMEDRETMEERIVSNEPARDGTGERRGGVLTLAIFYKSTCIYTLLCTHLRCCNSL